MTEGTKYWFIKEAVVRRREIEVRDTRCMKHNNKRIKKREYISHQTHTHTHLVSLTVSVSTHRASCRLLSASSRR